MQEVEVMEYQYNVYIRLAALVKRQALDAGFKLLDPAPSPEVRALRGVESDLVRRAEKILQKVRDLRDDGFVYAVTP